jgi:hypothetical protein
MTAANPPSADTHPKHVHAKALAINLDPTTYGSFAEIGAGQEVARWFLRVGAAAGTVAQTISAYDKTFSDETYGAGTRYVSKERVVAMLDYEYGLLLNRLGATRDPQTRFFAFADTVAARDYRGDNDQHGWLGVRFQAAPGEPPSDLLIHINLRDPTAQLQQEAIGVLGVNLLYAAFYQRGSREEMLAGVFDGLSIERIELDVIEVNGPGFAGADARRACLETLRRRMCHAVVFDRDGKVVEPSAVLRKRPLIVGRRRFEAVGSIFPDAVRASEARLTSEGVPLGRGPVAILELSIRPAGGRAPQGDDRERLLPAVESARASSIVMVSNFSETYLLVEYLRRYSTEPIRLIAGASNLALLMAAEFYNALPGRLLEGLGRLLTSNVKIYVQPMPKALFDAGLTGLAERVEATSDPVTADTMRFKPPVEQLYRYVRDSGWVVPLTPGEAIGE